MSKIWWVLGWDSYYPGVDNFIGSFYTEEEAEEYIVLQKSLKRYIENYKVINISNRL